MLLLDHDQPLEFWEYPCQAVGCEQLFRFTKEDGQLSWEPIDGFTTPDSPDPWSQPVDALAVINRRIRERRPAA